MLIPWDKAMTAASQDRLKDFFDRMYHSEKSENRKRIAELTASFADLVEGLFRQFVEDHPYLLGGHEGVAVFDAIPPLKATCVTAEELNRKLAVLHKNALEMLAQGAKLESDPEENRLLIRFYDVAYKFRMEELQRFIEGVK